MSEVAQRALNVRLDLGGEGVVAVGQCLERVGQASPGDAEDAGVLVSLWSAGALPLARFAEGREDREGREIGIGSGIPELRRIAGRHSSRQLLQSTRVLLFQPPALLRRPSAGVHVLLDMRVRRAYLQPVGDVGVQAANLAHSIVEHVNCLVGLQRGLQMVVSQCASTLSSSST